ncbi:MAG: uracil-DNA glycosylase [Muribaculaceae bacterium]|nr:uracil-DNA glycosylase [Muribaculaceae bacterium]
MYVRIEPSWQKLLAQEFSSPYFVELAQFVRNAYANGPTYPPAGKIFAAFDACPFDKVKVVILGQDPYHEPGQANGLAFSVYDGTPLPPSLINIFREIEGDTGVKPLASGDLRRWSSQGVMLLNSTLTVQAGRAGSHQGHGWEEFTDAVISHLSQERSGLVFMLWGSYARRKGAAIDRSRHLVLESPHPSPLSAHRGFFGNHHFSLANDYLKRQGKEPIDWR